MNEVMLEVCHIYAKQHPLPCNIGPLGKPASFVPTFALYIEVVEKTYCTGKASYKCTSFYGIGKKKRSTMSSRQRASSTIENVGLARPAQCRE